MKKRGLTIPEVLVAAFIFLMIMLKVPALIYLGAGILGMTAAELCERCERVEPTTDQWRALVTYLHGSGARLLGDVWGVSRETP